MTTKDYKYDLAISLCKQDVEFARKLVKLLNPSLKVFFYEDRQVELITKSGPEAFAKVFKEECRVVLILSRKEWSETFYTDIERNAIIDRTSVQNQGYGFLMVMPMVSGEIPSWYPSTYIYASPSRFQIEDLVRFIEFKIADQGGEVKPLTTKEHYDHLLKRMEEKKELVKLQETPEAIGKAKEELQALRTAFNERAELLKLNPIGETSLMFFYPDRNMASFQIGEHCLNFVFNVTDELFHQIVTTQNYIVKIELQHIDNLAKEEILEDEFRLFFYSPELYGWSLQMEYKEYSVKELPVMFRDRKNKTHYDLSRPISSTSLIDEWFQKLLKLSSAKIERFL